MDGNERPPRPGRGRAPRPAFWLLTRRRRGRTEVLAAELVVGARALAVFSFSEEARLFVGLGPLEGAGWRAAKIGAGELASLLLGPLRGVERVALDPLPGVGLEPANRLVCLSREGFLDLLLNG